VKKVISGNEAVSLAVKLSRVQVISAYPITPQTTIAEKLSEICGSGELDAKFVKVESEHSAMATLIGAASTGVRCFTATSAQGLALMHELLFWISGARLPVVLVDVNRAMAAPWTIWCDQTDSVSQRDTGLMQFYCWSNQEILDSVICSFKEQEEVDNFLPPRKAETYLDTKNPMTFSSGTLPNNFMEFRYKLQKAFELAPSVISNVYNDYKKTFDRSYKDIEAYNVDDADIVLIASGSAASTVYHAVKKLRAAGKRTGFLRIRQLRPLPENSLLSYFKPKVKYGVLDRNLSPGTGGVFAQEIRGALNRHGFNNRVYEFIAGLGGRDISEQNILGIFEKLESDNAEISQINWIDIKGK